MASLSKKWARIISRVASQIYFLLIIFQVPLFRRPSLLLWTSPLFVDCDSSQGILDQLYASSCVSPEPSELREGVFGVSFPCRIGICETPMEVTSSQLIASEVLPTVVVKIILSPGAIAKAITKKTSIPTYNDLLSTGKFINLGKGPSTIDLKHMEVLAGSYFSVAGAFLGLIRSGRMSLFGVMLIILGIAREVNFGKHAPNDPSKEVCMYRSMYIAVLSAFFSIRGDVRKLIRSSKVKYIIHPLRHSKAKHK